MVFFMLRDLIGARAFYAGLREFWRAKRFRTASWSDLQAAFEHSSGRDLAWYFSQWVERAGAPRLRIESAKLSPAPGGTRLKLTFSQSTPAYRLRVPVELVTGPNTQTRLIDLAHERQPSRNRSIISLDRSPRFSKYPSASGLALSVSW